MGSFIFKKKKKNNLAESYIFVVVAATFLQFYFSGSFMEFLQRWPLAVIYILPSFWISRRLAQNVFSVLWSQC